jgi:hypothetical protein
MITGFLTFLKTPLGTGVALALGLLLYVQLQRKDAAEGAAAECKADVYRSQLEDLQRQLRDANNLAQTNRQTADLAVIEQSEMEKERDKLVAELRTTKNECSKFTPDHRERVRKLKP